MPCARADLLHVCMSRICRTQRSRRTTFYVSPDTFLAWRQYYEEPTPDEDADFLIIDTDNDVRLRVKWLAFPWV